MPPDIMMGPIFGADPEPAKAPTGLGLERRVQPSRPFEVVLRWRTSETPVTEATEYRWRGAATDEAHALVQAQQEAAGDGWNADHASAYTTARAIETTGFLPVATEWTAERSVS